MKVSLRVYTREIEGLIEGGQVDEAIAHCLHILKTFPMYVETYHLLGKAFLESRRYADAADIFQRVLMVMPDDFVAHVGMSIIRDDEGRLDEAIWHMERAFEIQPSNPAIQGELRRLYGRRDGVEPPKVRLTRDALANMYSQGELFNQAIAEIRSVLAEDPNRPDLQIMLARAYYRAGQKVEATEMCTALLKRYPYCLDALRIMLEIMLGTGRVEDTRIYRQRVKSLDPYAAYVTGSVFQSNEVPDGAVSLDRLEYEPGVGVPVQPGWAESLGIKLEAETSKESVPEWLASTEAAEQPAASFEPSQPSEPTPSGESAIPEWMRSAEWQEATGEAQEGPIEFGEPERAEPIAGGEMPDWLKSTAPSEVIRKVEETGVPESAQPPFEEPVAGAEEVLHDWLKEYGPMEEPQTVTSGKKPEEKPVESAPAGAPPPSPEDQDAAFAWLESLAAKQGAKPEELLTKPEERLETPPEWVQQAAKQQAEPAQPAQPAPPAVPESERPAAETATPEEETLDWLESLAAKPEEPLAKPQELSEAMPEWAEKTAEEVEAPKEATEGDITAWLKTLESPEGKREAPTLPAVGEPEAEASAEELPEWLRDFEKPSPEPVAEEQEVPEWLRALKPSVAPGEPAEKVDINTASEQELSNLPGIGPMLARDIVAHREAFGDFGRLEDLQNIAGIGPATVEDLRKLVTISGVEPEAASREEEVPEWLREQPETPVPIKGEEWVPAESAKPEPEKVARPRPTGTLSKVPGQDRDVDILAQAQAALEGGKLNEAIEAYSRLIKKGRRLDEVIYDLREAQYRHPVDVIVWQTLGDAYMRANRLQDALDAYTKAEELLR